MSGLAALLLGVCLVAEQVSNINTVPSILFLYWHSFPRQAHSHATPKSHDGWPFADRLTAARRLHWTQSQPRSACKPFLRSWTGSSATPSFRLLLRDPGRPGPTPARRPPSPRRRSQVSKPTRSCTKGHSTVGQAAHNHTAMDTYKHNYTTLGANLYGTEAAVFKFCNRFRGHLICVLHGRLTELSAAQRRVRLQGRTVQRGSRLRRTPSTTALRSGPRSSSPRSGSTSSPAPLGRTPSHGSRRAAGCRRRRA